MKYEDVLLIGGPEDGRRLSVLEGIPSIQVGRRRTTSLRLSEQSREPNVSTIDALEYRRMSVRSHKGIETAVYVFGDIDHMVALIEGYRKP